MTNRRIKKMFYRNIYMLWAIVCLVVGSTSLCANDQIALDSLVNLLNQHKNSPGLIKSILKDTYPIVSKYMTTHPEKAAKYADTMLKFAHQIDDEVSILKAQVLKIRTYIYMYKPDSVITPIKKLIPAIKKINNQSLLAVAYTVLGAGYDQKNQFDKSLENYLLSIQIFEKQKGLLDKTAATYLNIAQLFLNQEKPLEAKDYAMKAKEAYTTLKEYHNVSDALTLIGVCHMLLNSNDSAQIYLEQALALIKQHGETDNIDATLGNLAIVYAHTQNFEKAIPILLEILERSNDPSSIAAAYSNLISCYVKTKDLAKAKKTAKKAIEYVDKHNLPKNKVYIYEHISDLYTLENKFESALKYYKMSKTLNDSLNNQSNLRYFNELNVQYETAQKEHKIAKLKNEQEYQAQVKSILIIAILALSIAFILAIYFYLKNRKLIKTLSISNENIQMVNKRLESTNIALEQSHIEKNEFLGIVAHDLKNPIANISLIADTMKKFIDDDSPLTEMIDDINSFTTNMIDLITNLLDIDAIESGKFNINTTKVYPYEILMASVYMNRNAANKKNINLVLDAAEQNLIVNYDERILREIVENYVSNAIKFSPFDKSVYISLSQLEDGAIKIAVKDEGPGLSDTDKAKLFTKYTKLTARPTADENSTGLGLSIVKKLAELLNSQVLCESTLGQGAEFSLIIPAECAIGGVETNC